MGKDQIVTFRCPQALLEKMERLALHLGCNRNAVVVTACKLFSRQVKERGGFIYTGGDEFSQPDECRTDANKALQQRHKSRKPRNQR